MTMTSQLVEFVRPACVEAVDRAIHDVDPDKFHGRINGVCPFCPTLADRMKDTFLRHASNSPAFAEAKAALSRSMDAQDAH